MVSSCLLSPADRSALLRGDREPDGAPTSLARRVDPREMGSRVQRQTPKDLDRRRKMQPKRETTDKQFAKQKTKTTSFGYTNIIEATQNVEGLIYRPQAAKSRGVYELILSFVHRALGDQAQDIVRNSANAVPETLKKVPNGQFSICEPFQEDHYGVEDETMVTYMAWKDAESDNEVCVAVDFDPEEQEGVEMRENSDDEHE